jgi:diguanylate cyclase (GGDEF)-like protein
MSGPRTLLALHRPGAGAGLADGLGARGFPVEVTHNMAATWQSVRREAPEAIVLAPLSQDTESVEFSSLLRLAAGSGGPSLIVLTDGPDFLEERIAAIDDFLPTHIDVPDAARRVRFAVARRAALLRLREEREQLRQQSMTDFKTGLFNDRCFAVRSREEVSRARRQGQPLGVMMIDLDGFKAINDVHGHAFGDHALRSFATQLQRNLRNFDISARTGGDEFAVLLPGTRLLDAVRVAERLHAGLSGLTIEHEGRRAILSLTMGVASWAPQTEATFEQVVHGADAALLAAKGQGRGRIGVQEDGAVRLVSAAGTAASASAAAGSDTPARKGGKR